MPPCPPWTGAASPALSLRSASPALSALSRLQTQRQHTLSGALCWRSMCSARLNPPCLPFPVGLLRSIQPRTTCGVAHTPGHA